MPDRDELIARFDACLETEFTFIHSDELADIICPLAAGEQLFVLDWAERMASINIEIAHQFVRRAPQVLKAQEPRIIEAWLLHAMDTYDEQGLRAAMTVIQDIGRFIHHSHARNAGVLFDEVRGMLQHFVHGLAGRPLKLAQAEYAWTDGETLHLPDLLARLADRAANTRLYKVLLVMQWAQIHYGSLRQALQADFSAWSEPQRALEIFARLETLRLEAVLMRILPGLGREMCSLLEGKPAALPVPWQQAQQQLQAEHATAESSLALLEGLYAENVYKSRPWQPVIELKALAQAQALRVTREKQLLRVKLAEWLEEQRKEEEAPEDRAAEKLSLRQAEEGPAQEVFELILDEVPLAPPEGIQQLLTSIQLDLGEIPDDYLVPAGPGEYSLMDSGKEEEDPDAVWRGTYHERGALYYPEWDYKRQHYRKNWCVMREKEVAAAEDDFIADTLQRYSGLVARLRRSFEAMRDEERLLRRQVQGDHIDIDALVEALADARDGSEMSDRLFMRLHRVERDIAVAFMVDMSGSTQGWINQAEREALLLLCEALQVLGDRYAIYGFSGTTRKRCELYRIKQFDEPYGPEVRARISGIRAQDYTRMGFAIRHLTELLNRTGAHTRMLVTLSDGKPDDYSDYRGEYGIEDTRRALLEARRSGIHPFCITIDEQGPDYLPHMYGAVNYTVVSEVRQLPFKVAEIYRRLTL